MSESVQEKELKSLKFESGEGLEFKIYSHSFISIFVKSYAKVLY